MSYVDLNKNITAKVCDMYEGECMLKEKEIKFYLGLEQEGDELKYITSHICKPSEVESHIEYFINVVLANAGIETFLKK